MIWDPSPNGIFSTAATWKSLYDDPNTVHWYKLVWFQGATPRHSILMWLAILNRLSTQDRIQSYTAGPLACTLCFQNLEDHNHLFFNCTYSNFIWQDMLRRMNIQTSANTWEGIISWAASIWKKKTPSHTIPRLALGAAVYLIWRERNARTFRAEFKTKEKVLTELCSHMRAHVAIRWKHDRKIHEYITVWDYCST